MSLGGPPNSLSFWAASMWQFALFDFINHAYVCFSIKEQAESVGVNPYQSSCVA